MSYFRSAVIAACLAFSACGGGSSGKDSNAPTYTIGGTVSGLAESASLVLQNSGSEQITIRVNGTFAFSNSEGSGSPYTVRVTSQPSTPPQNCTVTNGTGTIGSQSVHDIVIACSTLITEDNASSIAKLGTGLLEILPQITEFLGLRLTFLSTHIGPAATENCPDPNLTSVGSVTYAFDDSDGSGSLSMGDFVSLAAMNCYSRSIGDYVTTDVTLRIESPPQPADYQHGFAARARLVAFRVLDQELDGDIEIVYSDAPRKRLLQAGLSASSLVIISDVSDTVTVIEAQAEKVLDYSAARYRVIGSARYRSLLLQGEFSMGTSQALAESFYIYPTSGSIEFQSGPSRLEVVARDQSDNHSASVLLSASGLVASEIGPISWGSFVRGFSWHETRWGGPNFGLPTFDTRTPDAWFFNMIHAEPLADPVNDMVSDAMGVSQPITLYFTAPLDLSRTSLAFVPDIPNVATVPAVIEMGGAIVTITPERPLDHGVTYDLVGAGGVVYTAAQDAGTTFNPLHMRVDNNLQADGFASPAVAAPGQTVTLRSPRSFSTNSTIVAASWQQMAGTPVQLNNANNQTASFVVPSSATDGEALTFNLTVTDANGEIDTAPITAFVFVDLSQPFVYYRRGQGADRGLSPDEATLESALKGPVSYEFRFDPEFDFLINLNTPGAQLNSLQLRRWPMLEVGTFPLSASSAYILRMPPPCNSPDGYMTIHEIQRGPSNEVVSFAADFEQVCPGGVPPMYGSVRVNSIVPLP